MMGTKVIVLATMGTEVKKNSGDDEYATTDDGYKVGRRRLLDRATTGLGQVRTAEIGQRRVLGGQRWVLLRRRRPRSCDNGLRVER